MNAPAEGAEGAGPHPAVVVVSAAAPVAAVDHAAAFSSLQAPLLRLFAAGLSVLLLLSAAGLALSRGGPAPTAQLALPPAPLACPLLPLQPPPRGGATLAFAAAPGASALALPPPGAPLQLCVAVSQPRAVLALRPDLPERLALQAAAAYPQPLGAAPDTLRLRVQSSEGGDGELPAQCTLLTPPEGLPLWPDSGATERVSSCYWRAADCRVDCIVCGADGAALDIPAPTHATQYACAVPPSALARLREGHASQQLHLHLHIPYRAFSWHSQPELQGACGSAPPPQPAAPMALESAPAPPPAPLTLLPPLAAPPAPLAPSPPPLCSRADGEGQWRMAPPPLTALGLPGARVWGWDAAALPATPPLFWTPSSGCALRTLSVAQVGSCLAERWPTVRLIGDSNTRRVFKTLWGLLPGPRDDVATTSAWCSWRRADHACVCEDYTDMEAFSIPVEVYSDPRWVVPRYGVDARGRSYYISYAWQGALGATDQHQCYSWEEELRARLSVRFTDDLVILGVGNCEAGGAAPLLHALRPPPPPARLLRTHTNDNTTQHNMFCRGCGLWAAGAL
jgi:hypothetical protein